MPSVIINLKKKKKKVRLLVKQIILSSLKFSVDTCQFVSGLFFAVHVRKRLLKLSLYFTFLLSALLKTVLRVYVYHHCYCEYFYLIIANFGYNRCTSNQAT